MGSRDRLVAVAALAAGLFLLTGCGDQTASSLAVGDCFDDTPGMFSDEGFSRVPSVPCTEPHDNEVFHVTTYSGSTFSVAAIDEFASNVCYGAFAPYIGRSYETSVLEFGWFIPTADSWALGDREVTCVAFHMDLQKLQRPIRGSGL